LSLHDALPILLTSLLGPQIDVVNDDRRLAEATKHLIVVNGFEIDTFLHCCSLRLKRKGIEEGRTPPPCYPTVSLPLTHATHEGTSVVLGLGTLAGRETKQAAAQVVTGQTADHGVAALTHAAHLNTRADAVDHDTATTDGGGESGDDFLREEHLLGEALDLHATTETVGQ